MAQRAELRLHSPVTCCKSADLLRSKCTKQLKQKCCKVYQQQNVSAGSVRAAPLYSLVLHLPMSCVPGIMINGLQLYYQITCTYT